MKLLLILILALSLALSLAQTSCTQNSDCPKHTQICVSSSCVRKGVFPLIIEDFLSAILVAIGVILSNASGLGGGAITIAILVSVMKFSPGEAIPIANFCMFMGAVARLLISMRQKHPQFQHKTAVHYDFVIILLPLGLMGALVGALVNFTFPDIILTILIIILFSIVIIKSIQKARKLNAKKKRNQQPDQEGTLLFHDIQADLRLDNDQMKKRDAFLKLQNSHCQCYKLAITLGVFFSLVIVSVFQRGPLSLILGISRCSIYDWMIQLIFLIICIIAACLAGCLLIKENTLRQHLYVPIDVKWTPGKVAFFSITSTLIGVVSAALGIGGGIIITPLLFSTGQPPTVASLTSIYIIFFISLGSTIIFISNGKFIYDYGILYGMIVLLGSFVGLWFLKRYIEKKGGQIVIVILLIGVSFIALILLLMVSIQKILSSVGQGRGLFSFTPLCN